MSIRKLAVILAAASAAVLLAMVVVSFATGATQEAHEWYQPPAEYAKGLLSNPGALRTVFGLDVGFLVLYTAFFAALAEYLRKLGRPFVALALGALLVTTVLDIIEDHHIVAMLDMALRGQRPSEGELVFQQTLSASKFTFSYLSTVLFGLAIPRERKLGLALCLFLTAGTLLTAMVENTTGPAWRATLAGTRWLAFLGGFGLASAWLLTEREPRGK